MNAQQALDILRCGQVICPGDITRLNIATVLEAEIERLQNKADDLQQSLDLGVADAMGNILLDGLREECDKPPESATTKGDDHGSA